MVAVLAFLTSPAIAQTPSFRYAFPVGGVGTDAATVSAVDANGNLYVAGWFEGTVDFDPGDGVATMTSVTGGQAFVARYDVNGVYAWAFALGSVAQGSSVGSPASETRTIAIASNGDVVVGGRFSGTADFDPGTGVATLIARSNNSGDLFLARYTSAGAHVWSFALPASVASIAIDGVGDIAVAGHFAGKVDFDPSGAVANVDAGFSGNGSMYIAKYSGTGGYRWAYKIAGSGKSAGIAYAYGLAVDPANNVWVTGSFSGSVNFNPGGKGSLSSTPNASWAVPPSDAFVAKYSATGRYLLAFRFGGNASDRAHSIAVRPDGGVVVAGQFASTTDFNPGSGVAAITANGASDFYIAAYTSAGVYLWASSNATPDDDGGGNDLAVDAAGNAYVAAAGAGSALASYAPTGTVNWAFPIDATISSTARSVCLDASGTVYLTGSFRGAADFDPGSGAAILTSNGSSQHDGFVASYTVGEPLPRALGRRARIPAID